MHGGGADAERSAEVPCSRLRTLTIVRALYASPERLREIARTLASVVVPNEGYALSRDEGGDVITIFLADHQEVPPFPPTIMGIRVRFGSAAERDARTREHFEALFAAGDDSVRHGMWLDALWAFLFVLGVMVLIWVLATNVGN